MAQDDYDNTDSGALFGNDQKRDGKKDPDLQGKLNIKGTEHWIAAWFFTYKDKKTGATRKGISIRINKPVEEDGHGDSRPARSASTGRDSDIPF